MLFSHRHPSLLVACLLSVFVSVPVFAQSGHVHGEPAQGISGVAEKTPLATGQGVVKKVDPQNRRITLAHEAIPALNWPAMTMAFAVADQAVLEGVKAGDRVSFDLRDEMTLGAVRVVVEGK
jgi:Cu(I)/Ag(I) efflux system protein CusF